MNPGALKCGLVAWLVAAAAFAGSPASPGVTTAVEFFEVGKLVEAKAALEKALADPALSDADRITARSYLAATFHAQRDPAAARRELESLSAAYPDAKLDPLIFVPELVAMFDALRLQKERPPAPVVRSAPPEVVAPPPERGPSLRDRAWIPLGAGAAAAATGGVLLVLANQNYQRLLGVDPNSAPPGADGAALRDQGSTLQALGWAGLGVGAGALSAGAWMFFAGNDAKVAVTLSPGAQSVTIGLATRLP